jgi:hypothetical protein
MQKLKKQKINQLINYQTYFKKIKINPQKIIYENKFLLSFNDLNIVENNIDHNALIFNNSLINITNNTISTIEQKYNDSFLFNYKLTFLILTKFHNNIIKKKVKKNIIFKGLVIIKTKKLFKKIFILKQQIVSQKNNKNYIHKCFYLLFGYLFKKKVLIKRNIITKTKRFKNSVFHQKKMKLKILFENQLKAKKMIIQVKKNIYNISRLNYLFYIIKKKRNEMIRNTKCVDKQKKSRNASI